MGGDNNKTKNIEICNISTNKYKAKCNKHTKIIS